jgi:hypothetical protein
MGRARTPQDGDFPIAWTPDLRARYERLVPYYPWLPTVNEAYQFYMATTSLYRPAYSHGSGRRGERDVQALPWRETAKQDVDTWRARDLGHRWATSDRTAQALRWLEDAFGGYDDPEGS